MNKYKKMLIFLGIIIFTEPCNELPEEYTSFHTQICLRYLRKIGYATTDKDGFFIPTEKMDRYMERQDKRMNKVPREKRTVKRCLVDIDSIMMDDIYPDD